MPQAAAAWSPREPIFPALRWSATANTAQAAAMTSRATNALP